MVEFGREVAIFPPTQYATDFNAAAIISGNQSRVDSQWISLSILHVTT